MGLFCVARKKGFDRDSYMKKRHPCLSNDNHDRGGGGGVTATTRELWSLKSYEFSRTNNTEIISLV